MINMTYNAFVTAVWFLIAPKGCSVYLVLYSTSPQPCNITLYVANIILFDLINKQRNLFNDDPRGLRGEKGGGGGYSFNMFNSFNI